VTDIREILRRLHLGEPDRRIARDLGVSRNTVAHYRLWAGRHGVLDGGPVPDAATLAGLLERAPTERPAHEQSRVEPWRERVLALHEQGVEGQAIWQLLVEEHGFPGSYSSVKRFLRRVAPAAGRAVDLLHRCGHAAWRVQGPQGVRQDAEGGRAPAPLHAALLASHVCQPAPPAGGEPGLRPAPARARQYRADGRHVRKVAPDGQQGRSQPTRRLEW
jgi:hypothetical protein